MTLQVGTLVPLIHHSWTWWKGFLIRAWFCGHCVVEPWFGNPETNSPHLGPQSLWMSQMLSVSGEVVLFGIYISQTSRMKVFFVHISFVREIRKSVTKHLPYIDGICISWTQQWLSIEANGNISPLCPKTCMYFGLCLFWGVWYGLWSIFKARPLMYFPFNWM